MAQFPCAPVGAEVSMGLLQPGERVFCLFEIRQSGRTVEFTEGRRM